MFSSVGDASSTQTVLLSDLYSFFVSDSRTSAHLLLMTKFQKAEEVLLHVQAIQSEGYNADSTSFKSLQVMLLLSAVLKLGFMVVCGQIRITVVAFWWEWENAL